MTDAPDPTEPRLTVDGTPLVARRGQTIAGALLTSGRRSWRTTARDRRPRGLFCGIGVCFDCLVTVNDRPNQRACLVPLRPGDAIRTQDGTGHDA
jgi:hypothetical protein